MQILNIPDKLHQIHDLLLAAGATDVLLVGGFVRDFVLEIPSKDLDVEVFGLNYHQILDALRPFFRVQIVGQSFSVMKIDNEIDIAIPRRESKTGMGHCAFDVTPDPNMTFEQAAARRDFTINAIGMRLDGTFCDPYHGLDDLRRKRLRATTEAFCEDPLRVLRGMQFAARFGFTMDDTTAELCLRVRPEFPTLSAERVFGEWEKWALKGTYADLGLDVLRKSGWIQCFPLLDAMSPETFEHTKRSCRAAAQLAENLGMSAQERAILLFAVLIANATSDQNVAYDFLQNMRSPIWIAENASVLVPFRDFQRDHEPSPCALRHFSVDLMPSCVRMWNAFASALQESDVPLFDSWVATARDLGVAESKPEPLLLGRDLMQYGVQPGKAMGSILREAWSAQLDGLFTDAAGADAWLRKKLQDGNL